MADISPIEALKRALSVATNLSSADENSTAWTESYYLLDDLEARDLRFVALAMGHLLLRVANYSTDLTRAVEAEGIAVEGIPGGTTPTNLLAEVGRQVIEIELEE